jgi:hypothetical protein
MPRLMLEVIESIMDGHPDLRIAARVAADDDLGAAIRRCRADVLIIMQPDGDGSEISAERLFWRRPAKVLAIVEGGRKGVLFVLHPHATPLGELSAESLLAAIRSESQA